MSASSPRVHVVYEYGIDARPHSSPFIRLIRPFSHPRVQAHVAASLDLRYEGQPADLVIVDRLWRPDVSLELVGQLVKLIRDSGARLVYNLDDNFFDLILENKGWPPPEFLPIVTYLLRMAYGVIVSTPALRERLLEYNPNILVLPNQLDERLLVGRSPAEINPSTNPGRMVIGAMGTYTHDEDFLMILPALEAVHKRHPNLVELQVVGALRSEATKKAVAHLPVRYIYPRPEEHEYPLFMLWFTSQVRWDIALSPLRETPFTRCKSDIKFLDYSAIGSAGIYSKSPAYKSTVKHKENGWLAENTTAAWEEALETLITDHELRLHIARNATRYLYSERILAQRAPDWVEMVNTLLAKSE
jgi:processive 1,2-diacylglycerol beta-glucosyltransferase